MKLFITGALGHIGSRFIRQLPRGSFESVGLLDDLSSQRYPSLFDLDPEIPFHFIEEDICSADLESHFDGVDVVVHLAAITDAASSFGKQAQVELVNYEGTECVARACAATDSRLIFLSTTSVYGVQEGMVDEACSYDQLCPQSPYAETKLRSEELLRQLGKSHGLRFITCRFGTVFGASPGMRFHTAVNKFIWQAVTGRPLTVWRTALDQKRPYLDLDDAVRALSFIITHDLFENDLYNVVTMNATVRQIIDTIRLYVPNLNIDLVDERMMNQLSYEVSSDRFRRLGFTFDGDLSKSVGESVRLLSAFRSREPVGYPE